MRFEVLEEEERGRQGERLLGHCTVRYEMGVIAEQSCHETCFLSTYNGSTSHIKHAKRIHLPTQFKPNLILWKIALAQ
jgi:hypothetical protein